LNDLDLFIFGIISGNDKMKTYVISLSEPTELLRELKAEGVDPVLVAGVRGSTEPEESIRRAVTPFWASVGPKSAIGCGMSHMNAWKSFLASGDPHALFVEDDVVFEKGWKEEMDRSIAALPSFDLLYLGCLGCDPADASALWALLTSAVGIRTPYRKVESGLGSSSGLGSLVSPGIALGTHAYVLSRPGAEKLRALDGKVHNHIDYCIQMLAKKGKLDRYMILPRVAYQTSTETEISSNVSSVHPSLVAEWIRPHSIDTMVRMNYLLSLSIGRLGGMNLTIFSLLFLLFGILLRRLPLSTLTVLFLLLSVRDLGKPVSLSVHLFLFLLPAILYRSGK
jgi:Glycosyltransferase family 25 (LPS biosynthesis protein)